MDMCVRIWKQIITTEETPEQQKIKKNVTKYIVILSNAFFVVILMLYIVWGFQLLYTHISTSLPFLQKPAEYIPLIVKDTANKNPLLVVMAVGKAIGFIAPLIAGAAFVFLFFINSLIYLYKLVRFSDLLKVYLVVEFVVVIVTFTRTDTDQKGLLLLKTFDKVFGTSVFTKAPEDFKVLMNTNAPVQNKPTTVGAKILKPSTLYQVYQPKGALNSATVTLSPQSQKGYVVPSKQLPELGKIIIGRHYTTDTNPEQPQR